MISWISHHVLLEYIPSTVIQRTKTRSRICKLKDEDFIFSLDSLSNFALSILFCWTSPNYTAKASSLYIPSKLRIMSSTRCTPIFTCAELVSHTLISCNFYQEGWLLLQRWQQKCNCTRLDTSQVCYAYVYARRMCAWYCQLFTKISSGRNQKPPEWATQWAVTVD